MEAKGLFLIALIIFVASLFIPFIRKTIGLLLIILGTIGSLSFIGALLGIPMIIFGGILLFIGDKSPNVIIENKNVISSENERRIECPFCSELIKETAKICRYCGRDLPENHLQKIIKRFTCPNCKRVVPSNLDYCPHCKVELFSCEECSAYIQEHDLSCPHCGIKFVKAEEEKFRGSIKRLIRDLKKK